MTDIPLFQANDLTKIFSSRQGLIDRHKREVHALDGVDLTIY